jgi:hypothetical protein
MGLFGCLQRCSIADSESSKLGCSRWGLGAEIGGLVAAVGGATSIVSKLSQTNLGFLQYALAC